VDLDERLGGEEGATDDAFWSGEAAGALMEAGRADEA